MPATRRTGMSTRSGRSYARTPYTRPSARRRLDLSGASVAVTPGVTRTGGYYGRYLPGAGELKFLDLTFSKTQTECQTGAILSTSLVTVPQNTTESGRIGRKVTVKAISIRLVITLNTTETASNTDDGLRVIVFLDKQTNGQAATVTDILKTNTYLSFNNLANKDRFRILSDKFIDIACQAGAYDGSVAKFGVISKTRSMHLKLNLPIEFSGTTGAITELRSHNIGILVKNDQGKISVAGTSRVRYSDT